MILEELVSILKDDVELKNLLKSTVTNSKIMPMPLITDGIGYNFIPLTNNGCVAQSQLELTIINANLLKCYEIKARIDKLIITIGDNSLTNNITGCHQNGGGIWWDEDLKMQKVKANYTIVERMM